MPGSFSGAPFFGVLYERAGIWEPDVGYCEAGFSAGLRLVHATETVNSLKRKSAFFSMHLRPIQPEWTACFL